MCQNGALRARLSWSSVKFVSRSLCYSCMHLNRPIREGYTFKANQSQPMRETSDSHSLHILAYVEKGVWGSISLKHLE
jgi:hypothetical protein